ncbi:hypothetical protein [Streptomyces sp. NPDC058625]|uniref:hypothetical protein n=1 Tax=Streptomyces sp. NPDC058625 TaxID=3346564 RepID=UPI0036632FA3
MTRHRPRRSRTPPRKIRRRPCGPSWGGSGTSTPWLAEERGARQLAEAEARHLQARLQERGDHIEDLQRALAALTPAPDRAAIPRPTQGSPAPVTTPTSSPAAEAEDASDTGRRRRWWPRRD